MLETHEICPEPKASRGINSMSVPRKQGTLGRKSLMIPQQSILI